MQCTGSAVTGSAAVGQAVARAGRHRHGGARVDRSGSAQTAADRAGWAASRPSGQRPGNPGCTSPGSWRPLRCVAIESASRLALRGLRPRAQPAMPTASAVRIDRRVRARPAGALAPGAAAQPLQGRHVRPARISWVRPRQASRVGGLAGPNVGTADGHVAPPQLGLRIIGCASRLTFHMVFMDSAGAVRGPMQLGGRARQHLIGALPLTSHAAFGPFSAWGRQVGMGACPLAPPWPPCAAAGASAASHAGQSAACAGPGQAMPNPAPAAISPARSGCRHVRRLVRWRQSTHRRP